MSKLIDKSLVWIPFPGLNRETILNDLTSDALAHRDCGDHVWVASMDHNGTLLYCYAVRVAPYQHGDKEISVWYVKRIPESVGPDVYDCPVDIMEMCRLTNADWRQQVMSRSH